MAGVSMRKAVYVIEILGFISAMTCVLVLVGVINDTHAEQIEPQQAVVTGTLG